MADDPHNDPPSNGAAPSEDAVRDVLAAEEFAVGSGDPTLHRGPVKLPDDPSGIAEPHDVLAAEEFALPAGPPARVDSSPVVTRNRVAVVGTALLGAAGAVFSVLRRRRRRSRLDRARDLLP